MLLLKPFLTQLNGLDDMPLFYPSFLKHVWALSSMFVRVGTRIPITELRVLCGHFHNCWFPRIKPSHKNVRLISVWNMTMKARWLSVVMVTIGVWWVLERCVRYMMMKACWLSVVMVTIGVWWVLERCVKHDDEGLLTISGDGDDWCVVSVRTVCETWWCRPVDYQWWWWRLVCGEC